jgi:hypothetical protein
MTTHLGTLLPDEFDADLIERVAFNQRHGAAHD